jgi:hypothetical protein
MIIDHSIYKMSPGAGLGTFVNEITDETFYLNEEREIDSCLVLCFEERDDPDDFDSIDTRIFVTYDFGTKAYIVNGKRIDIISEDGEIKQEFQPFMFCVNESSDVADFIVLTFSKNNKMSYTMYNYNNLPEDACDMTYEFMENNMDRKYEISAFDHIAIKRSLIKSLVRMTRQMYN